MNNFNHTLRLRLLKGRQLKKVIVPIDISKVDIKEFFEGEPEIITFHRPMYFEDRKIAISKKLVKRLKLKPRKGYSVLLTEDVFRRLSKVLEYSMIHIKHKILEEYGSVMTCNMRLVKWSLGYAKDYGMRKELEHGDYTDEYLIQEYNEVRIRGG